MTVKVKEPITSTLSYTEYQQAIEEGKILPKYYIVDALQQYVFCHTRNRVIAFDYFKLHYPQYTLRTSRADGGGGSGCSDTSSTRRGQSKFQSDFGIPQGLR